MNKKNIKNKIYRDMKFFTLLLWCFFSSLFIWYFVLVSQTDDLLNHYLYTTMILFSGGFVYHVASEIIRTPCHKHNFIQWKRIKNRLKKCILGFIIAALSLTAGLFLRKVIPDLIAKLIALVGVATGIGFSVINYYHIHRCLCNLILREFKFKPRNRRLK